MSAQNIASDVLPAEAPWKFGTTNKLIDAMKEMATRLARRVSMDTPAQDIFDAVSTADGDLFRRHGFSPYHLMIGRTPPGIGISESRRDPVGESSAILDSRPMQKKLQVQKDAYTIYLDHHLSTEQHRRQIHRARIFREWASGELCWYWRAGRKKWHHREKNGVFRGPAKVLLQERIIKQGQTSMKGVVWISDGIVLIRCAPQHLRPLSEAEKRLKCGLSNSESFSFQEMVNNLALSGYLDLLNQAEPSEEDFEENMTEEVADKIEVDVADAEEIRSAGTNYDTSPLPHRVLRFQQPLQQSETSEQAPRSTISIAETIAGSYAGADG